MYPGRSREIKTHLAEKVQQAVAEELKMDKSFVSVSIEDVPQSHWAEHLKSYEGDNLFIAPQ